MTSAPARAQRALLAVLTAISLVVGGLALLAPHVFYRHVLGVDLLGPYDQHLVVDVGGFYLGFALLLGWAARALEPLLTRAVCSAFLLVQALHFAYHAIHLGRFSLAQGVVQTVLLAALVLLPALVLTLGRRPRVR